MPQGLTDLSAALALRLRDLARAADRLDRLESGSGNWLASQDEAALREAATDMVLRALRVVAEPTNYAILAFLSVHTSAPVADLERAAGLGRLALSERVNDLVQVGLAARNIDTDHVQITAGGAALARLIGDIGAATAQRLTEALQPQTVSLS